MPDAPRVFISYARADSTSFVNRLEQDLKAQQFDPWVDRRKLEGGAAWLAAIQQAIDDCQAMVVVLSPAAVQSQYVHLEYHYAQEEGKLVIPVQAQAAKTPMDLRLTHCLDFQASYEEGLSQLLQVLSRLMPPAMSPTTPTGTTQPPTEEVPVQLATPTLQRCAEELSDVVCWRHESLF